MGPVSLVLPHPPWEGFVPSKADRITLTVRVAIGNYVMFTSS